MTKSLLLGEIVRKDGALSLQTGANVWYPLGGNSDIAERFRESFGEAQKSDIGRRLYLKGDVIQMENMEQTAARKAEEKSPLAKHRAAIERGEIAKSNVIGIRKAIGAAERLRNGYSVSSTAPRVTVAETDALVASLAKREPRVVGELHESGLKVLRSPRYRKRWNEAQAAIIERLDHFKLVGFVYVGPRGDYPVPAYRAVSSTGQSFIFHNTPWQTAWAAGEESGPIVVNPEFF